MRPEVLRAWVRLHVLPFGGALRVVAESHDGRFAGLEVDDTRASQIEPLDLDVAMPGDVIALVNEVGLSLEGYVREGTGQQVRLPLFVRPPRGTEALRWDGLVRQVGFTRVGVVPIQPVLEVEAIVPSSGRFALPLRVGIVEGRTTGEAFAAVQSTSWGRPLGLASVEVVSAASVGQSTPFDVLVCDDESLVLGGLIPATLAVVVAAEPSRWERRRVVPFLQSRSVVVVNDWDQALGLFEALSHDVPLHEAVSLTAFDDEAAVLVSTPEALHDLRLRDLVTQASLDAHRLAVSGFSADGGALHLVGSLERILDDVSFDRETLGLEPIAALRSGLDAVMVEETTSSEPEVRGDEPRERAVDITIRKDPGVVTDPLPFVSRNEGLRPGAAYHVLVSIGFPSPWSLVEGEREPIDRLLAPSPVGHELDIVLFRGDFDLEGEQTRRVYLPIGAAAESAEFPVRAPTTLGPTGFRIGVYHRHNLLQTFLVTTEVLVDDQVPDRGTVAMLDHSVTRTWDDVGRFGGRRLSIVLNDDGVSHRLYVDGSSEGPADWHLGDSVQTDLVAPLRALLADHVHNSTPAEDALRKLAIAGHKLVIDLDPRLGRDNVAKSLFRGLAGEDDKVIQVVRADVHQAIPWALLYDWHVPDDIDSAAVCWGTSGLSQCTHVDRKDLDVVCARGFWGVRHRIEELVGSRDEPALTIKVPSTGLTIDLARGLPNNTYIDDLVTSLQGRATVSPITSTESLLDRLWDTGRASVCAVVGHLNADHEIECGTSDVGIDPDSITEYARDNDDLDAPNPLVCLFVCESGQVTPELVASHALALTSAGIAGLVCTETIVRSSHIETFGSALVDALVDTIGVSGSIEPFPFAGAFRRARAGVLEQKMVAGLAFLAFGPATLEFEAAP
jgi:hypothetical protein